MRALQELISKTNAYISRGRSAINIEVISMAARYTSRILEVFGLTDQSGCFEFPVKTGESQSPASEDKLMLCLQAMSKFRDSVRRLAREKADHREFLLLTDALRDQDLVELGVLLDDQEDGRALVKLVDREELLRAREEKQARERQKAHLKQTSSQEQENKRKERLLKGKTRPEELFTVGENAKLYSKFDDLGIPTYGADGVEITKNRRKKMIKEYETQKKLHREYLDWSSKGGP